MAPVSATSICKRSEKLFSVWDSAVVQLQQPPHGPRQVPFSKAAIIPSPNVHCSLALFFLTNHCRKRGGLGLAGKLTHRAYGPLLCRNSAMQELKRPESVGGVRAEPRYSSGKDIFSCLLLFSSLLILRR